MNYEYRGINLHRACTWSSFFLNSFATVVLLFLIIISTEGNFSIQNILRGDWLHHYKENCFYCFLSVVLVKSASGIFQFPDLPSWLLWHSAHLTLKHISVVSVIQSTNNKAQKWVFIGLPVILGPDSALFTPCLRHLFQGFSFSFSKSAPIYTQDNNDAEENLGLMVWKAKHLFFFFSWGQKLFREFLRPTR